MSELAELVKQNYLTTVCKHIIDLKDHHQIIAMLEYAEKAKKDIETIFNVANTLETPHMINEISKFITTRGEPTKFVISASDEFQEDETLEKNIEIAKTQVDRIMWREFFKVCSLNDFVSEDFKKNNTMFFCNQLKRNIPVCFEIEQVVRILNLIEDDFSVECVKFILSEYSECFNVKKLANGNLKFSNKKTINVTVDSTDFFKKGFNKFIFLVNFLKYNMGSIGTDKPIFHVPLAKLKLEQNGMQWNDKDGYYELTVSSERAEFLIEKLELKV